MDIEVLRDRPFLTGLLLGVVTVLLGEGAVQTVALLALVAGVVLAIFGEGWHRPAGQALASTGGSAILLAIVFEAVAGLFRGLAAL